MPNEERPPPGVISLAEDTLPIPTEVREVAGVGGGRLVFVLGAGCSVEPPSSLPTSKRCSRDAWQHLVDDHVLAPEDCVDPDDLSCVADAVYEKCDGQAPLVRRLPPRFRFAEPNEGSLLAAALLREGVAHHIVTLNLDLTMTSALGRVGAGADVQVIRGPEDHARMGNRNLVYLHRNIDAADPDTLVLRTADLDENWQGNWEEVVAHMALATPVVVFAGLGTPVGVLIESTRRIKEALGEVVKLVQVDVGRREDSAYAAALGITDADYVCAPWSAFMRQLGERVVKAYIQTLREACRQLIEDEGVPAEDAETSLTSLVTPGLLALGQLRARWTLDASRPYLTAGEVDDHHIADLMLAVSMLERLLGARARFMDGGLVELRRNGYLLAFVALGSGRGVSPWLTAETRLRTVRPGSTQSSFNPTFGILAHVRSRPENVAPPDDIGPSGSNIATGSSIVTGAGSFPVLHLDDLRDNPSQVDDLIKAA
jgi:hypothetical protein